MKKQETILLFGLLILSALSSFLFVMYGVNVINSGREPWVTTFAYVTVAYGLGNIAILSVAWSSRDVWAAAANKLIALCYFGVFVMDSVNAGIKSSAEILAIMLLALILLANWFAVKKVIERS